MLKRYKAVRDFHMAFAVPLDLAWEEFQTSRADFRYTLLEEEFTEWLDATLQSDRVEQLDALIDVQYIALGTLVECGANLAMPTYSVAPLWGESLADMVAAAKADAVKNSSHEAFCAHLIRLVDRVEFIGRNLMFDMEAAFDEVHRSNMAKLGADGKPLLNGINCPLDNSKPEGKVLKPAGWTAPVLAPFVITA